MEQLAQILIYIHAFFGGLGLTTGVIAILVKKGSKKHKRSGKIFSISMFISCLLSLVVAFMPNHENLFLFLIGLFTIYLVISGNLALKFKLKTKANAIDFIVSGSVFVISVAILIYLINTVVIHNTFNLILFFFGMLGLYLGIRDFIFFKQIKTKKQAWLLMHLGKITGAFIASVTAFLIAGLSKEGLVVWLTPTIIGTLYIIYWNRKIRNKKA